eukprot:5919106-Amphidinium_carterae.1
MRLVMTASSTSRGETGAAFLEAALRSQRARRVGMEMCTQRGRRARTNSIMECTSPREDGSNLEDGVEFLRPRG